MILYRLSKERYATDLSGKGAETVGGRWNSIGTPLIYTSSSRALCMVEVAVHLPLFLVPIDYRIVTLEIPDDLKPYILPKAQLPSDWKRYPYPGSCQQLGDQFIKTGKYLLFKVPSAVVQDEWNYLINPRHKDIGKVKVVKHEAFAFDKRLFGKK